VVGLDVLQLGDAGGLGGAVVSSGVVDHGVAQGASQRGLARGGTAAPPRLGDDGHPEDGLGAEEHGQKDESLVSVKPPMQRNWIYDRKCRHHHRMQCKITLDLTYETFVEYLNYVQMQHRDYWHSMEQAETSNVCFNCQAKKLDRTKPIS